MTRRIGIRARVIILACLAALPLFFVALYNAKDTEGHELEDAYREALVLARTLATLQADVISHTGQLLYGLAAGYETRPEALFGTGCAGTLRRIAEASPVYSNVTVADAQGNIRCSVEAVKAGVNVADRDYFRRATEESAFNISDPITGRVTGRAILVVAQPVRDPAKRVSAVLMVSIDIQRLGEVFERASPSADIVATLVDMDGRVMARRPHAPEYVGTVFDGFRTFKETSRGGDEGLAHVVGLDGVPRVAAYARLPEAPGAARYVIAGIPQALVERQATDELQRNMMALAITLLLALGLGFVGAQRLIVNPLRKLTRAAERYGRGELSARSGVSHEAGEVGMLATAFDALATSNEHVTRALRALSAGSRTLVREKDEASLLAAMCKVAVDDAGYRLAMVNYAQHDERKSVRTMAKAGHDEGFVDALDLTWADEEAGSATVGPAIRSGRTTVVRSIPTDPHYAIWRERAMARGFGSVASFPLRVEGVVMGTFTLISADEDEFDDAEIELLNQLAADLSFGIEVIRGDAKRREAEAIAKRALTQDALVDLPNRATFIGMVNDEIANARRTNARVAALVLHIGRLPEIFDSFGYDPYRVVLREIAGRLAAVPVCANALGRLPMEDFGVVAAGASRNSVGVIVDRLLKVFERPIRIGEARIDVTASVGVSFFPEHGDDGESLVRRASIVGREGFRKDVSLQVYNGPTERENPHRLSLAADLRAAIEGNVLELHYQPKVRLSDGAVCGCEALVRWSHASRGRIAPLEFIPVAEQMGLIGPMTYNIMKMAVRQQHEWRAAGRALPIAINLSARILYDPMLVKFVDRLLKSWSMPADLVEFEITESALVDDPQTARKVLTELRAMGSRIYIDDFGTGYSSLRYLVTLPVNSLKVDRSFIRQMANSPQAHCVVSSIISMAHNLNMGVVAEGVETEADREALKNLGCDEAQGYLFGKPVPPHELVSP